MKTTHGKLIMILLIAVLMGLSSGSALAEKPIVIGCPLATAFLYGWDAERGVTLAIEEINAQGEMSPAKNARLKSKSSTPGISSRACRSVKRCWPWKSSSWTSRPISLSAVRCGPRQPWRPSCPC